MTVRRIATTAAAVVVLTMALPLVGGGNEANAIIHEIIGAGCRAGGEDVVPPGQTREGASFARALIASGFIESIEEGAGDGNDVLITFNPDNPNSKFRDAGGGPVTLADEFGPGVDLILSPGIEPDPDHPAHAHCKNLNP